MVLTSSGGGSYYISQLVDGSLKKFSRVKPLTLSIEHLVSLDQWSIYKALGHPYFQQINAVGFSYNQRENYKHNSAFFCIPNKPSCLFGL